MTRRAAMAGGAAAGAAMAAMPVLAQPAAPVVEALDPAFAALVDPNARLEKLATGFQFADGTLWRRGALWFGDIAANKLYRMTPDGRATLVMDHSGYAGEAVPNSYFGSNGMASAPDGTLTLCQQGARRVSSLAADGTVKVLVDRYEGKTLNSPNDVVYAPDGSFYFVDPPFGLLGRDKDAAKELGFNGVFRFAKGKLQLLIQDIPTPHGIAFAPDYRTLYLTNGGRWLRYAVAADGALGRVQPFADTGGVAGGGLGMKADAQGNLWATGPGGVWVFSKDGKNLGRIHTPEPAGNVAFGDDDRRTLYVAARTSIYRIKVKAAGVKPPFG